jgi:predicted metal-binding membrane protein
LSKIEFIDRTVTKYHPLLNSINIGILTSIFCCGCIWMFLGLELREVMGLLLVHFAAWYFLVYPKVSKSKVFVRHNDNWLTLSKKS